MTEDGFDPVALAAALQKLSEFASNHAPPQQSPLIDRIVGHIGESAADLPVMSDSHPVVERPNLQLALNAWATGGGRSIEVVGLSSPNRGHEMIELANVVTGRHWGPPLVPGPPSYAQVAIGPNGTLSCLTLALVLVTDGDDHLVALLSDTPDMGMRSPVIQLQVMATREGHAAAFLAEVRTLAVEHNVFRGQVISFASSDNRMGLTDVAVRFHERDAIDRGQVILAEGVLERIERHVIGVADHADSLRASGRDLKRGLLLFGPPGTGKTLTVQYLAARQTTRTVMLVAGADLGGLTTACRLARVLSPATVVLEDVDLVAEERTMFGHGQNSMIAALLNEMDAVDNAADVVFILTTNRADLLEPALANRPGRVDQAIEVGLPDAECRDRLIHLYGASLGLTNTQREALVRRLDGVTAAFVKELMRRATVLATLAGHQTASADVDDALDELFDDAGALTRTLLGAAPVTAGFRPPPGLTIPAEVLRMMNQQQ
jgi:cell division protease FtsH